MTIVPALLLVICVQTVLLSLSSMKCENVVKIFDDRWKCWWREPEINHKDKVVFRLFNDMDVRAKVRIQPYVDKEEKSAIDEEIKVLEFLKHDNVANLLEKKVVGDHIYLITEAGKNEDLLSFMPKNLAFFKNPRFVMRLFLGIMEGVKHIHSKKYVHSDLKTQNIELIKGLVPKITFAELAIPFSAQRFRYGTPFYQDPVFLGGSGLYTYNTAVDIYSLGVILYEMTHGTHLPFMAKDLQFLWAKIKEGKYLLNRGVEVHAAYLINWALQINPQNRPTIEEMIQVATDYLASAEDQFIAMTPAKNTAKIELADFVIQSKNDAVSEADVFENKQFLRNRRVLGTHNEQPKRQAESSTSWAAGVAIFEILLAATLTYFASLTVIRKFKQVHQSQESVELETSKDEGEAGQNPTTTPLGPLTEAC